MRRFFLGLAIASLAASAPITAFGGDREIADQIIATLKKQQAAGSLKGFDIDLSVEEGVVTLTGSVASSMQAKSVIDAAQAADGVKQVVSEIEVRGKAPATAAMAEPQVKMAADEQSSKPAPLTLGGFDESELNEGMATKEPPKLAPMASAVSSKDASITDESLRRLAQFKSEGKLKNFELDISTVDAEVWVRGFVATNDHKQLVLSTIQRVPGVARVIDDLAVTDGSDESVVQPASGAVITAQPQVASMPVMGQPMPEPRAFAPSIMATHEGMPMDGSTVVGGMSAMPTPVPMNMGPSYGAGVPRYDMPQMPNYAWPSYAAHPNYAAVTYPKQYSASAWPYIGPFYPYPQVPLGWRKVALEWDDGLWYLDFTSK